jgi:putative intracellular protease/amidase
MEINSLSRRSALSSMLGAILLGKMAEDVRASSDDRNDWQQILSTLPDVTVSGSEQIAMLVYPGFTALDLIGPHHFLAGMMGAQVHLVTNQRDLSPVKSDLGMEVIPTHTLEDCPKSLTVVFVPGGTLGTLAAAQDPGTLKFLREHAESSLFVTSVCTGSLVLGAAGLLKGKKATSHWSVLPSLTQFDAIPLKRRWVQDGKIITGAGVTAGLDFGLSLVASMRGKGYAEAEMLMAEYDPQPPFTGGRPDNSRPEVVRSMSAILREFVEDAKTLQH